MQTFENFFCCFLETNFFIKSAEKERKQWNEIESCRCISFYLPSIHSLLNGLQTLKCNFCITITTSNIIKHLIFQKIEVHRSSLRAQCTLYKLNKLSLQHCNVIFYTKKQATKKLNYAKLCHMNGIHMFYWDHVAWFYRNLLTKTFLLVLPIGIW